MPSHPKVYETIGVNYQDRRRPDPRIAAQVHRALGDAQTICNIGAGAGSYEPTDRAVTAVEPSSVMIAQRKSSNPVVNAVAEQLPFEDKSFDAAMAVLTIHHWQDVAKGLAEMARVASRQVVFTFDPNRTNSFWLVDDYLPEIKDFEVGRAPSIEFVTDALMTDRIEVIPIPWDCTDGFQAAYWRRPEQYLIPDVRAAISTMAQLPQQVVERGVSKLKADLDSGVWHKKYAELLDVDEMDFGYRLVIADHS